MENTRNCSITKIGVSSIQRFSQAEGSIKNAPTSLPFETDCGTIHIAAARVSNKRTDTKQVMFEKHALATFNPIRHTTHSESHITACHEEEWAILFHDYRPLMTLLWIQNAVPTVTN